ncbi:MAG TPA: cupin domain-containing protein [Deinococcales bacterium]|nr:cupin domain-containing protein [Deinococcales bacterium]
MPHPDLVTTGTAGEVIDLGSISVRPLVAKGVTGGAYSAMELVLQPGAGSGTHRHHGESETFFVREGEVSFLLDGEPFTAGPGACVSIPRGLRHSFRNAGPAPAAAVIVVAPGGLEGYFRELRTVLDAFADDPELGDRVQALNVKYKLEFEQ